IRDRTVTGVQTCALPILQVLPALLWIVPPLAWGLFGWWWAAVTTLISVGIWVAVYWAEGAPLWYAVLYPFGAGVVAGIMIRSAWGRKSGGEGKGGGVGGG